MGNVVRSNSDAKVVLIHGSLLRSYYWLPGVPYTVSMTELIRDLQSKLLNPIL